MSTSTPAPATPRHEIIDYPLDGIVDHPGQAGVFGELDDAHVFALAESLATEGQRDPVYLLPGGKLLAGHHRTAAARRLGWRSVRAVVRYDLADDPLAAETFFLTENQQHRSLTVLQRAAAAARLAEIEAERADRPISAKETARRVGQRMRMSGTHAARLIDVAKAPRPIRASVEAGELTVDLAAQATRLPRDRRNPLVAALAASKPGEARTVVRRWLAAAGDGRRKPWSNYSGVYAAARKVAEGGTIALPPRRDAVARAEEARTFRAAAERLIELASRIDGQRPPG